MRVVGKNERFTLIRASILSIVILTGLSGYFLYRYHVSARVVHGPSSLQQIISEVKKIYPLPTDEQPVLAQVQDASKLSAQPFFKNVHTGDDVLIYQKHELAVIYRVAVNKIINAGAAKVNVTSASTPQSTAPSHFDTSPLTNSSL